MIMTMGRLRHAAFPMAGLLALVSGCNNAGEDLGIALPAKRDASALVVYDRNFDGLATLGQDTTRAGITVRLLYAGTNQVEDAQVTDAAGVVNFFKVSIGSYTIRVDSVPALGDSMVTVLSPATIQVYNSGNPPGILALLTYRVVPTTGVRSAPVGRRLVTTGVMLSTPPLFSDTTAFLRDTAGAIRLTAPAIAGAPFVIPGDSVRVLGTVRVRDGQRVLDSARISLVTPTGVFPGADTLTSAAAASAAGGTRDADLVFVGATAVLAAVPDGAGFLVSLDDGSGPVEMALDSTLGFLASPALPGDSVDVTGVLVPTGLGTWRIRPRIAGDFLVY
jgi:hypothetical protein